MSIIEAHYLTIGGAEITITTDPYPHRYSHWTCAGCKACETGAPIRLDEAMRQANSHADTCRTLPPR